MNPRDAITALLQEWHRLTRTEARAIEARSWPDVRRAQDAKARLQPRLSAAIAEWTAASRQPDHDLRAHIGRLIALESSNAALLAEQRRKARAQLQSLLDSRRNLARLRGSYAPRRDLVFDSYS